MAVLHVGTQETTIRVDDGDGEPVEVKLAFGAQAIARRHFRHEPPTAGELESAIEAVEDVLMPAVPRLRGNGPLVVDDDESVALLAAAGLTADRPAELAVADIERLFNRLADVAGGHPAASAGMPVRGTFAAHLVILRELMHHAARATLTIVPCAQEEPGA